MGAWRFLIIIENIDYTCYFRLHVSRICKKMGIEIVK